MRVLIIVGGRVSSLWGLADALRARGHQVDVVHPVRDQGQWGLGHSSDLVLLDWDPVVWPERGLADSCRWVRCVAGNAELMVLAPNDDSAQVIAALDAGADDCVARSVAPAELTARTLARLRRRAPTSLPPAVDAEGEGLAHEDVMVHGPERSVALTPTEARILRHLRAKPQVTVEEVAKTLLGRVDVAGRGRDLAYRHIANLRRKLREAGLADSVESTRSGYIYVPHAGT